MGMETVMIGGRPVSCEVEELTSPAEFRDWGSNFTIKAWRSSVVPGSLAKVELSSRKDDQPFSIAGQVVGFGTASQP